MQNLICGIVGRKGSGKSTLMGEALKICSRLFVFDTMGEHRWVPNRFYDLEDAERFLAWGHRQQTFAGSFIPEGDLQNDFGEIGSLVYE